MSTDRKNQLRANILEKFETIKYFCKLSKYSYSNFKTYLNSRTPNEEIYQDAIFKLESLNADHIEGNIRQEDRDAIKMCLRLNFDSYTEFSKKHDNYDTNYISNIIKGRLKYETPKYNRLVKLLKRDYNLKLETDEPTEAI